MSTCQGNTFQCAFRHHSLDGEGNLGQVEVPADDLFADDLDHLLANRPNFVDLLRILAYSSPTTVSQWMPVLFLIGEIYITIPLHSYCASVFNTSSLVAMRNPE